MTVDALRRSLRAGDMREAARLLGRPFSVEGLVVRGEQRGRTLGFPTANLMPDRSQPCPLAGVYACRAVVLGPKISPPWPAAVSIGTRPMFDTKLGEVIEAHLIGFVGDLYDSLLRVEFLSRLRDECAFPSVSALVDQIGQDVARTAAIVQGV